MRRRTFLHGVTTGGVFSILGGCLTSISNGGQSLSDEPTTTSTATQASSTTPEISTDTPETATCSSIFSASDKIVCWRSVDDPAGRVSIEPESPTFTVDTGTSESEAFIFTLHNRTEERFVLTQQPWHIMRQTSSGWAQQTASDETAEETTIAPGTTHKWSLSLQPHPTPLTDEVTFVFAALPEDSYTFVLTGHFASDPSTQIELQARFTLETTNEP